MIELCLYSSILLAMVSTYIVHMCMCFLLQRVFAFVTHGLFSPPAIDRINKSVLEEVVVTDTIQLSPVRHI